MSEELHKYDPMAYVEYSTHMPTLRDTVGILDSHERTQAHVDAGYSYGTQEMWDFVARFRAMCEDRGVVGDAVEDLTREAVKYKATHFGRQAQGAYNPSGKRDVRHMSTLRANKGRKGDRVRRYLMWHAAHQDLHRRQMGFMASLERAFCTSKDRKVKRRLRQIGRFLAMDSALHLPVVFGGDAWYDVRLRK